MSKRHTKEKLCIFGASLAIGSTYMLFTNVFSYGDRIIIRDKKDGFKVTELEVFTNNEKQEKGYIFFDGNVMKSTCDFVNHQNECIPALEENKEKIIEQLKICNSQEFTYQTYRALEPVDYVLCTTCSIGMAIAVTSPFNISDEDEEKTYKKKK